MYKGLLGFAEVNVPTNLKLPVLPKRVTMQDGSVKLVFPVGKFSGVLLSEELKEAKSLGVEVNIIKAYPFNRGNPLNGYIKDIYRFKSTGDKVIREIAKLMLNALFGKFGMRLEVLKYTFMDSPEQLKGLLEDYYITELKIKDSIHFITDYSVQEIPRS
uniref:DNA polymerase type B n=1 Tax=Spizellomyces sp. 'palustris' TaxID=117820 RepID=UPI0010FC195B|nr:DNA polymerase type B [Spizellomyces sp. 'palustris']QCQ69018.1 DNA polymerase type B [Spizellomyces sp. 'palustris']